MKKKEEINKNIIEKLRIIELYTKFITIISKEINNIDNRDNKRMFIYHITKFNKVFNSISWERVLKAIKELNLMTPDFERMEQLIIKLNKKSGENGKKEKAT